MSLPIPLRLQSFLLREVEASWRTLGCLGFWEVMREQPSRLSMDARVSLVACFHLRTVLRSPDSLRLYVLSSPGRE